MKVTKQLKEKNIWAIRAGKNGNAHALFIEKNLIVLSDAGLGDLSILEPERSAFYEAFSSQHPDEGKVAVGGIGGKFFRFVHEMKTRDFVLYPCIKDKQVYIGQVTSSYRYDPTQDAAFPHQRCVKWICSVPKKSFSGFAQRELGAARTFFRFKSHVAEIHQLLAKS
jgi:predicted Mrr-cat superfamily restriction endonuclease